jgi:hypothetical protein
MAFTPPVSPTTNQIYSAASGENWIWNGAQWIPYNPPLGMAAATAGSFNGGGATTFGTNPITISNVQPLVITNPPAEGLALISTSTTGTTWAASGTLPFVLQFTGGNTPFNANSDGFGII